MLKWYSQAYEIGVCCFRYFNAAGATETHGENHLPETHLVPLLLEAAAEDKEFVVNGGDYPTKDGTCIRDYVHVLDIAQAHILALQNLESPGFSVYNIGTGSGFSVSEVLTLASAVTEKPIRYRVGERRQGDPAILCASPRKITAELSWKPQHSQLEHIIETAWKWKTRK
jgi:UDP-glucose 4-epimerase